MSPDPCRSAATTAITAGRDPDEPSLAPVVHPAGVWRTADLGDAHRVAVTARPDRYYSRYGNPTVRAFERAIAELEGAEDALAFGSGMGAIASTVLALCSTGDHVVASRQLYAGTTAWLQGPCQRFGIDVTFVDGTEPGALAAAVRPGRTMLVIVETPSNPRLELCDLAEVGSITGPFTVVDSTFATPLGQRPLDHGVDLVVHSATKGIAGHNDATLGVIAGEAELVEAIWGYSVLHGAAASPHDAAAALRGVRTLAVRTRSQCGSAQRVAEWLDGHPDVAAVWYPGLASHPQHELATRQMAQCGTVLAVELAGGRPAAERTIDRLALIRCATSLGGPETIVCHPMTSTHVGLTGPEQAAIGITPGLLRLSIGLEDTDDLIADIDQALRP